MAVGPGAMPVAWIRVIRKTDLKNLAGIVLGTFDGYAGSGLGRHKTMIMEVSLNAVKFKPTSVLTEFVDKKVKKVETLLPQAIKAEVTLKVDKEHDVCNKVADVRIVIPGDDLYASKQCDTFEEAVDQCVDALKKQIEKLKDKWNK